MIITIDIDITIDMLWYTDSCTQSEWVVYASKKVLIPQTNFYNF